MDITEVRVFPVPSEERLKAYATITIDHVFLIRDLRIINGNAGTSAKRERCCLETD